MQSNLYANDWGQQGVASESFPYEADGVEQLFWDEGKIIQYQLSKDDLLNGVVLDRSVVHDAIRAIFERNKALLEFKINRMLIKNRIKEV